jgi:hypothetical protein
MKATTRDIGLALRDALEHLTHITVWRDDECGDDEAKDRVEIWNVDVSDPDNPILDLANGQSFTIRIFASKA